MNLEEREQEFTLAIAALARYLSNAFVNVEVELTAHIETDPVAVARLVVDVHEGDLDGVGALRVERHPVRTTVFGAGSYARRGAGHGTTGNPTLPFPPTVNRGTGGGGAQTRSKKSDRHVPNNMDHLAFKYMEMCKVDTDSDSEISPRWSDTSTVGCVSIAPQSETLQTLQLKPAARHGCYSLFLDPYDGSSEDSDESNINDGVSRRTKQRGKGGGGGCRFSGRSRTFVLHHPASVALREVVKTGMRDPATEQQHLFDIQMKCGSDSEVWVCELDSLPSHSDKEACKDLTVIMANDSSKHPQTMDIELQPDDFGLQATISSTPHTPVGGSSSQVLDSSSERSPSPCNVRSIYKRKLGLHGADVVELGQRKRQCVVNMEDQDGVDSASEPC